MKAKSNAKMFVLGQYFTKKEIVDRLIDILLFYKGYERGIKILEPSFGTGNFVQTLKLKQYKDVKGCEIDKKLTLDPIDFFEYPLDEKFDLIIGNPPFTKYNLKESYYYPNRYQNSKISPDNYLTKELLKKEKMQVENAFILKAIKHLRDKNSTIGFVLPISFFIKGKNITLKRELINRFSTIIIYQNNKTWFDYPIPCCFAIFTNIEELENNIVLLYEGEKRTERIIDKSLLLSEEIIPTSFLYKEQNIQEGILLSNFINEGRIKYQKSYDKNNISGANIIQNSKIPLKKDVKDYYLAITRVGNSSVGRAGLINIKEDVLNDMFYVFDFKEKFNENKELKEGICYILNNHLTHFKNLTARIGSKSIKKSDVLNFKVKIEEGLLNHPDAHLKRMIEI